MERNARDLNNHACTHTSKVKIRMWRKECVFFYGATSGTKHLFNLSQGKVLASFLENTRRKSFVTGSSSGVALAVRWRCSRPPFGGLDVWECRETGECKRVPTPSTAMLSSCSSPHGHGDLCW